MAATSQEAPDAARAVRGATIDAPALAAAAAAAATVGPEWLQVRRREALGRFTAHGLPSPRSEEWRQVNVTALAGGAFVAPAVLGAVPTQTLAALRLDDAVRLVFVDGRFSAEASELRDVPAGVTVRSLAVALAEDAPAELRHRLGVHAGSGDRDASFTDLNTAGFVDGALVQVQDGITLARPIHLVFWSRGGGAPAALPVSFPRALIVAGSGASLTIVETHASAAGFQGLTCAVTEIACGEKARVTHCKVQQEALTACHVAATHVRQERGSTFRSVAVALGARLAREEIVAAFAGEGAECTLDGLYAGGDEQVLATHSTIDHAVPRCTSRETYRGILAGRARGLFRGRIVVRPGADQTDARQSNKNLLLTSGASADSKPQLEIHADDVKCAHGAAIGQLDRTALFYLRARGIDLAEARRLLVHAFAREVTSSVPVPELRAQVERLLHERVDEAAAADDGGRGTATPAARSTTGGPTEVA